MDERAVHQVNHSPFAKVTSCLREIEVSNWGNIAVEEHYDLVSFGPHLNGLVFCFDWVMVRLRLRPGWR